MERLSLPRHRFWTVVVLCGSGVALAAQTGDTGTHPAATGTQTGPQTSSASTLLRPGLDAVRSAVIGLRAERWKVAATSRDEADANLVSIRRDLDTTLPPLLLNAEVASDSVAKAMPAYRNVEALYDVLLRVDATARLGAPREQATALDQALTSLDASRRALAERMQAAAEAQEKKSSDLQAALKTAQTSLAAAAQAPAPVCAAPVPAKKKKAVPKSTPSQ